MGSGQFTHTLTQRESVTVRERKGSMKSIERDTDRNRGTRINREVEKREEGKGRKRLRMREIC